MAKTLKEKTAHGLVWSIIDKFGQQAIFVVFGICMAQLLTPSDFGLVGMLSVFSVMVGLFQESGFSAALIRKQEATQSDYSSVFYLNISISLVCYILLYWSAPAIAAFFKQPQLITISRVLFCSFFINSFGIIQYTLLNKRFKFKALAQINAVAIFLSGAAGVYMAYLGYGPWALVTQMLLAAFFKTTLLWIYSDWRPTAHFDLGSLKVMFSFSFKILLTNMINHVSSNLYPSLIGRFFNPAQVGFYTQAYKWQVLPLDAISTPIQNVGFPLLSELQHDAERQKRIFRKLVRVTAFISFPAILGFLFVAKEVVYLLLSAKWENSIILIQLLSAGALFYPLYCLFNSSLKANGHSRIILRMEIVRNILVLINLFCTLKFGINQLVIGLGITNILFFFINYGITHRFLSYKWKEFFGDIAPFLLLSIGLILVNAYICTFIDHLLLSLIYKITSTALLYFGLLKLFHPEIINEAMAFIHKKKENMI